MNEVAIMNEVKEAEKTARNFLEEEFEIYQPTVDQMDIMTRIVISNNGTKTLVELLSETKEVLTGIKFPNPRTERILDWMLAIATNNSASPAKDLAGITPVRPSPGEGLCVNY